MPKLVKTIGSETLVNGTTAGSQISPGVISLSTGGYVIFWQSGTGSEFDILGQIYDAQGAKVGGEFVVNDVIAGSQHRPAGAALPGGGFVITWTDFGVGDGSLSAIRGQRYDGSGAKLGSAFVVNSTTPGTQSESSVAALASGGFVVTWLDEGGGESEIRARLFGPDGLPLGGASDFIVNSQTSGDQGDPAVAGLAGGGFAVVWADEVSSGTPSSLVQVFDSTGNRIGDVMRVSQFGGGFTFVPTIAALPTGGFVVTWSDYHPLLGDTSSTGISAQVYSASGLPIGGQFRVNTETQGLQAYPSITVLPWGGFLIAWEDGSQRGGDTSGTAIKAQLFDSDGTMLGDEFLMNTTTALHQAKPAVAALSDGTIVATWTDLSGIGGDTSDRGIKAQLFRGPTMGTAAGETMLGTEGEDSFGGSGGNDHLMTFGGNDLLFGGAGDDVLDGGDGDDELQGNAGNDLLRGGAGNDRYIFGWTDTGTSDIVQEDANGGIDEVVLGFPVFDYTAPANVENLTGSSSVLRGNELSNVLTATGDRSTHFHVGSGGHDIVKGNGEDSLTVDWSDSTRDVVQTVALTLTPTQFSTAYSGAISDGGVRSVSFFQIGAMIFKTGSGNDSISVGGAGLAGNSIHLGAGNDRLHFFDRETSADGGDGVDGFSLDYSARTQGVEITLLPNFEYFIDVKTGSGNDQVTSGTLALTDVIATGAGDDIIRVSNGHDVVHGGSGLDYLIINWFDLGGDIGNRAVFSGSSATGWSGKFGTADHSVTFTGIERFQIHGGNGNDLLNGGDLQDSLIGGGGHDYLDGGAGADHMSGGDGDDTFIVDHEEDTTSGGAGTDTVRSSVSHAMADTTEYLVLTGSAAINGTGTRFADTLLGNGAANVLYGGDGNDFLSGGGGGDTLNGGFGDDIYLVDDTQSVVVESYDDRSVDEVWTSLASYTLTEYVKNLRGQASTGQSLFGNRTSNLIAGGSGNDSLMGSAASDFNNGGWYGVDQLAGGLGDDVYWVQAYDIVSEKAGEGIDEVRTHINHTLGSHIEHLTGLSANGQVLAGNELGNAIKGGAGGDTLEGHSGNDKLHGGAGQDHLRGGEEADELYGEEGDDTLDGGAGADQLAGGGGVDHFVYLLAGESTAAARDRILDFASGTDKIDLSALGRITFAMAQQTDAGTGTVFTLVTATNASGTLSLRIDGVVVRGDFLMDAGFEGGAGDDSFTGTDDADEMRGEGGNDTLRGEGGNDLLFGGTGVDLVLGGSGNDQLDGGTGGDSMKGGVGDDVYFADDAGDTIEELAGEGTDEVRTQLVAFTLGANLENLTGLSASGQTLTGNAVHNRLIGGSGNDVLNGGADADYMAGGAGNDIYHVDVFNDAVVELAGEGIDTVRTGIASYTLEANVENLSSHNALAGQTLIGNGLANFIEGSSHGDSLNGGAGADLLHGLGGGDVYHVDNVGDTVVELAGADGIDEVWTALGNYVLAANVEVLKGTASTGQSLLGNSGNNTIIGGSGSDSLMGSDLADWNNGNSGGTDLLAGGLGDDLYWVDGVDTVSEAAGAGTDEVRTHGNYTLTANVENLRALSDLGQTLQGNGLANAIYGRGGADTLRGMDGNDLLDGGAGNDVMIGGLGDDVFVVEGADTVTELAGEGTDEVRTALGSRFDFAAMYTLPDNVENLTGTSASGQGFHLNALDNVVTLGAGGDLADLQQGGNDLVSGGGGDDFLYWGGAFTNADKADGGAGYDTVGLLGSYALTFDSDDLVSVEKLAVYSSGNAAAPNSYTLTMHDANVASGQQMMVVAQSLMANEVLTFSGAAELGGSFNVRGGKGADSITGGAKGDTIWGNLGADQLWGGAGSDLFEYNAAAESTLAAADVIRDFAKGDKISLAGIDADGNAANGDSKFAWLGSGAFTGAAGQLRVTQHPQFGQTWVVEADLNGDKVADLTIYVVAPPAFVWEKSDFYV